VNERIWRKLYEAALSERDPQKLSERISETEAAIFLRLQTPKKAQVSQAELIEIECAVAAILRLQIDGLHFPELTLNTYSNPSSLPTAKPQLRT
jgi:hypothetical protein